MITLEIRNIIIKLLSGLLSFIFFFTFNLMILITVFKNSITKELISDFINYWYENNSVDISNTTAYLDTNDIITIDPDDYIVETDNTNESFETDLQQMLEDNKLPKDLYKYIDDSDDNKEIVTNIYYDLVNYVIGKEDDLTLSNDDIEKLLYNAIDNYEEAHNTELDKTNVNEFLTDFNTYYEDNFISIDSDIIKTINSIFYGSFYKTLIVINIIILIILIAINYNNYKVLLNIFIPTLITGITYIFIPKFIMDNIKDYEVVNILLNNTKSIGKNITIISILGIVIYIALWIKNKQEKESV